VVAVDADSGKVLEGPEFITRGFIYIRESGDLIEDAALCVLEALEQAGPQANARAVIKDNLGSFVYRETKRRPMILPVVMEI
jgi:ribonuclease J